MATTWLVLVLYVLVVTRLTRLIVMDKISEPLRKRLNDRYGRDAMITYLAFCPWCVSFWLAAVFAVPAAAEAGVPLWWAPGLTLAASQVAGMLLTRWSSE
jgi:hypothetical protein